MNGPAASPDDVLSLIHAALSPHGIFIRGVVSFSNDLAAPMLENGVAAKSVVLLGNIGGSLWEPFSRWRKREDSGGPDPLDRWSKALLTPLASTLGATAYFPSDPPWQPFQTWAMRAEGLKASPLGVLIHPEYGLWHGYRGALGFAIGLLPDDGGLPAHPCDLCSEKPCLSRCPVDAVTTSRFDVAACRRHLTTDTGQAGCMTSGCLARGACPVGAEYSYSTAQLRFHMKALDIPDEN